MPNESIDNSGEVVFLQPNIDQKPPPPPPTSNTNFLTHVRSRLPSRSVSPMHIELDLTIGSPLHIPAIIIQ